MRDSNRCAQCVLTALLGCCAACGDDGNAEPPDPAEAACVEVDEAGHPITASSTRDDAAPEIEIGAEPYAVRVSPDDPTFVRVEVAEDTAALLLVDTTDAVAALYHGPDEEPLESAGADEFCPEEIPEHFDLDLHQPGTYFIELGPSAVPEVWLLLSGAEGHAHAH